MTDHLLRIAIAAARLPAPDLNAAFRRNMQVDYKRDRHDPVTEHDRRAEAQIRDLIFKAVPDSTFMGEEGGSVGSGAVKWFVDPIDGTSNFAAGLAFWCTSVGAVIDDKVVAAAIHDPVSGATFSASGAGAWLADKPLAPAQAPPEPHATLITGYPVARDFRLDGREAALDRFGRLVETVATVRRPGSAALSIAHVAAGFADVALGFAVNAWDVAAASLILEQSGGRYLPFALGKVPADAPAYAQPGYVALRRGADYPAVIAIAAEISAGRSTATNTIAQKEGRIA